MTAHVTGVVDGMIGRVTYQAVDKPDDGFRAEVSF
jgi:hypothetical protein